MLLLEHDDLSRGFAVLGAKQLDKLVTRMNAKYRKDNAMTQFLP